MFVLARSASVRASMLILMVRFFESELIIFFEIPAEQIERINNICNFFIIVKIN